MVNTSLPQVVTVPQSSGVRQMANYSRPTQAMRQDCFSAEFDHAGKRVITAGADGTARIWDTATGLEMLPRIESAYDWIRYAAFDPTGETVVRQDKWVLSNDGMQ